METIEGLPGDSQPFNDIMVKFGSVKVITSLVLLSLDMDYWTTYEHLNYPALRNIQCILSSNEFFDCDKSIKLDIWSQSDFASDESTIPMSQVCNSIHISVEPVFCESDTAAQRTVMATNLRTFNAMLKSRPVLPRKPAPSTKRSDADIGDFEPVIRRDLTAHSTTPTQPIQSNGSSQLDGTSTIGLRDLDIPSTEEEFAKMVFERGLTDVFAWVQGALKRVRE